MQQKLYSDPIKGCRFTPRKSGEIPAQLFPYCNEDEHRSIHREDGKGRQVGWNYETGDGDRREKGSEGLILGDLFSLKKCVMEKSRDEIRPILGSDRLSALIFFLPGMGEGGNLWTKWRREEWTKREAECKSGRKVVGGWGIR